MGYSIQYIVPPVRGLGEVEAETTLEETSTGTTIQKVETKKAMPLASYLMYGGVGLFLLGNLGVWIVKGKDRKRVESLGKSLAIVGIMLRGAGELMKFQKEKAELA